MTAVTRAGTLSRVMISWGGTSIVTVLRSILTILSTTGRRMKSPGPLGPRCTLPILKITPRSYSLTILMVLSMTETTNIATTTTTTIATSPTPTACNKPKVAYTRNPPLSWPLEIPAATRQFDGHYLHYPSYAKPHHAHLASHPYHRLTLSRSGLLGGECKHSPPPLSVHEYPPLRAHSHGAPYGAHLADHPLPASDGRPPFGGAQGAQDDEEPCPHEHRDRHEDAEQHPRVGDTRPEERQASSQKREDGSCSRQTVVGHLQVYEEQRKPNEDQNHPDRRRYHHRCDIAIWMGRRYTRWGSIVGRT